VAATTNSEGKDEAVMATRGWCGVTREQIRGATLPRKFRNVRAEIGGERFDSKAEAAYWLVLRDREQRGEIYRLQRQVPFPLKTAVLMDDGQWLLIEVCSYEADFVYFEAGVRHVIDVKQPATRTAVYRLKRKWLQLQDGIVIEEVG
jgi:hypothetical protein